MNKKVTMKGWKLLKDKIKRDGIELRDLKFSQQCGGFYVDYLIEMGFVSIPLTLEEWRKISK